MTNLDSILKCRDITLPTKVRLVKAMVFPVVMCGCESWTIKKAEHRRIDAFEVWCWRRLLRVPWTARRSNQSVLRRSILGVPWKYWCWSWNSNALAIWCEELTHLKRLMLGKIEGRRSRGQQRMRWLDGIIDLMNMGWVDSRSWWWKVGPGMLRFMGLQRVRHNWATEVNWTELYCTFLPLSHSLLHPRDSKSVKRQWFREELCLWVTCFNLHFTKDDMISIQCLAAIVFTAVEFHCPWPLYR